MNWPTMWETWLLLLLFWSFLPAETTVVVVGVLASIASEFLVDFAKLRRQGVSLSFFDAAESVLIRLSIDLGRVFGNVSRLRLSGFFENFDFFCTGKHIGYERRVAAIKTGIVVAAMSVAAMVAP